MGEWRACGLVVVGYDFMVVHCKRKHKAKNAKRWGAMSMLRLHTARAACCYRLGALPLRYCLTRCLFSVPRSPHISHATPTLTTAVANTRAAAIGSLRAAVGSDPNGCTMILGGPVACCGLGLAGAATSLQRSGPLEWHQPPPTGQQNGHKTTTAVKRSGRARCARVRVDVAAMVRVQVCCLMCREGVKAWRRSAY